MKVHKTETQVWKVNNQIVHTHFISNTRQLFETDEGSYVYFLDEDKLIQLDTNKYTLLLIKLLRLVEEAEEAEEKAYNKKLLN